VCVFCRSNKTAASNKDITKTEKRRGKPVLDCGKPVASSVVDNLPSIINRHNYPHVPEPEVAVIFRTKGSTEVDMNQLEMQLRAAKKEASTSGTSITFGLNSQQIQLTDINR